MGPLKSKKYGSLVKAIYKFTMVRQNYGELLAIALISSSEIMWDLIAEVAFQF